MGTLYSVNCKEQFTEYIVHTATVTRSLFHLRASCEVTQIFGSVIMKFYLCKFICWIRVSSFIIKSVPSAGFKFSHHMLDTGPCRSGFQIILAMSQILLVQHMSASCVRWCARWSCTVKFKLKEEEEKLFWVESWYEVLFSDFHICAFEHIIGSTNTFWGSMTQFVDKNHPVTCVSREQHHVNNLKNTIM